MTPATAKRTSPSDELAKLIKLRDDAYAEVQSIRRERDAYDAETEAIRAEYTAFCVDHPEDHRDAARNAKPGSPSAEFQARVEERRTEPNPRQASLDEAVAKFHALDAQLQAFRKQRMPDLLDEDRPAFDAEYERLRAALSEVIRFADFYASRRAYAEQLVYNCDGLNGQHTAYDRLPEELSVIAQRALDHELMRPGITELGEWKLANG